MSCLVIGAAAVGVAASTVPVMKTAASEGYKKKVKAMKKDGEYEYIAIGEVTYQYTRPLRGTSINEPIYSTIARMKQDFEGNGNNRILAVVRQKNNGSVNFVLLKRPSNNEKCFDKNDPLNGCSIDPNLKTNQGGIVESRDLKVSKMCSNTFQIEDKNYRTIQTHGKLFKIEIKNTKTTPSGYGRFSGVTLCELLNHMAKKGHVPKDFPSSISTTTDSTLENENENKAEFSFSSLSSPYVVATNPKKNEIVSSATDVVTLQQCSDLESTVAISTATTNEYDDDDEVILADMATPTMQ